MLVCAYQNVSVTPIILAAKLILCFKWTSICWVWLPANEAGRSRRCFCRRNLLSFIFLLAHVWDALYVGWNWKDGYFIQHHYANKTCQQYHDFLMFCSIFCLLSPSTFIILCSLLRIVDKAVYEKDFINTFVWHQYLWNNLVTHLTQPVTSLRMLRKFMRSVKAEKFKPKGKTIFTLTAAAFGSDR